VCRKSTRFQGSSLRDRSRLTRLKTSKLVFQERFTQERVLLRVHGHQRTGDRSGQRCSVGGEERGESLSFFLFFGVSGSIR